MAISRRRVLRDGVALTLAAAAGGAGTYAVTRWAEDDPPPSAADPPRRFDSRPDLALPAVTMTTPAPDLGGGYLFLTPAAGGGQRGPMIVDATGEPVWFRSVTPPAQVAVDLKVQRYGGRPVLTWWEGVIDQTVGTGAGEFVVADTAYRELLRLRADGPVPADQHDLLLTAEGTALLFVYRPVAADLTAVGGPADGAVYDNVLQEVDVATGRARWQWRAADHVPVAESYAKLPDGVETGTPYDFFHANSVAVDTDGHLLVSARNTWTVYKLDRRTGAVLWRLGGKASDFTIGAGAAFSWQHDARRQADGTLGLFDNAAGETDEGEQSRGLVLRLDERARTATLARQLLHPAGLLAPTQGNLQELAGGRSLVGWGAQPHFSGHAPDGTLLYAGHLPADNVSYRFQTFPWQGQPADRPVAVARRGPAGAVVVAMSWNGATAVRSWRVRAGTHPDRLAPAADATRTGFETTATVGGSPRFLVAEALDGTGRTLGASTTVTVQPAQ